MGLAGARMVELLLGACVPDLAVDKRSMARSSAIRSPR